MSIKQSRRQFLAGSAALAGAIACGAQDNQTESVTVPSKPLPERPLGNTGVSLPIFGLGGAGRTPLSQPNQEAAAIAIIEAALGFGIRYFDTAASYGPSETYLGKGLGSKRPDIFLASKSGRRDRDGAWRELEQSLTRLKTDYLDLWQLHHVSFAEELDEIFSPTGAIKAIEEAQAQKLIRFTGISGHHEPDIIATALQRYPFDTTLISINAADVHHPRPFSTTVLPVAQAQNVGVITMKIPAYGRLFKNGLLDSMEQAMGYTLSLPGVHSCIIAAETVEQLASNVQVAQAFQPLNREELTAIEQRTAQDWQAVSFFRQWT